jgi:hypothetical protein
VKRFGDENNYKPQNCRNQERKIGLFEVIRHL